MKAKFMYRGGVIFLLISSLIFFDCSHNSGVSSDLSGWYEYKAKNSKGEMLTFYMEFDKDGKMLRFGDEENDWGEFGLLLYGDTVYNDYYKASKENEDVTLKKCNPPNWANGSGSGGGSGSGTTVDDGKGYFYFDDYKDDFTHKVFNQKIFRELCPNYATITEYAIPEGYTLIEATVETNGRYISTSAIRSVFEGCKKLTSVKLPSTMLRIGYCAFMNTPLLEKVVIPDSVKSINYGAFSDCKYLDELTISKYVSYISGGIFENCPLLSKLTFDNDNKYYTMEDGVIFTKDKKKLICCTPLNKISSYEIPQTVTEISLAAFRGCKQFTKIAIPEGVSKIESFTFADCDSLIEVEFPQSVKEISYFAFSDCQELEKINLGKNINLIDDYAFLGCKEISEVNISDESIKLGVGSFKKSSIGKLTIETSPASIGDDAFLLRSINELHIGNSFTSITNALVPKCTIKNIYFGSNITSIVGEPFYNCSIENVYYDGILESWTNISFDNDYANPMYNGKNLWINGKRPNDGNAVYELPESVKRIPSGTFKNCTDLTNVVIHDKVEEIGEGAFGGCVALEEITIPYIGRFSAEKGVKLFGFIFGHNKYEGTVGVVQISSWGTSYTYYIPASLKKVVLSGGQIPECAFYGCKIESISIPKTTTVVGKDAFKGCKLSDVYYLGEIADWFFISFENEYSNPMYCASNLYINGARPSGSFVIPDGVISIPEGTFNNCTELVSLTIPKSVTQISDNLFKDCTALEELTIPFTCTLPKTVKKVTVLSGEIKEDWCLRNETLTELTIGSDVTKIDYHAFYCCGALKKLVFLENTSLEKIGQGAFYSCEALEEVVFSENIAITAINSFAFAYCRKLTKIVIPDSVVTIGKNAFQVCTGLQTVVLGKNVEEIRYAAFHECTSLTEIVIPKKVAFIGNAAFKKSGLEKVEFEDSEKWWYANSETATSGTTIDVSNSTDNAENLKNSSSSSNYWSNNYLFKGEMQSGE